MRLTLLFLCLSMPFATAAQVSDPMDAQRGVWRCLADSPGAARRRYNQCVARYFSGEFAPQVYSSMAPTPAMAWRAGLAGAGSSIGSAVEACFP